MFRPLYFTDIMRGVGSNDRHEIALALDALYGLWHQDQQAHPGIRDR
ncbi:MAG: hypothetical protein Q8S00_20895 [Deltaproteobacteria bacterium]|nr:hypothetical protein [Deltaproteobacteria bacterium]MDZ4345261.1 hypothetical protein [Candidatus Binatia bacterium]